LDRRAKGLKKISTPADIRDATHLEGAMSGCFLRRCLYFDPFATSSFNR